MGGDPQQNRVLLCLACFDPRPRMGGDPQWRQSFQRCQRFDPRPRMGGDQRDLVRAVSEHVSIHAPAWGATCPTTCCAPPSMFRSTPPHGGRRPPRRLLRRRPGFDPRPRMGGDIWMGLYGPDAWVSIHAPAWGATSWREDEAMTEQVSIHAPAWGATSRFALQGHLLLFRSTPPHGGRRCACCDPMT